jgi:hypothetical protein
MALRNWLGGKPHIPDDRPRRLASKPSHCLPVDPESDFASGNRIVTGAPAGTFIKRSCLAAGVGGIHRCLVSADHIVMKRVLEKALRIRLMVLEPERRFRCNRALPAHVPRVRRQRAQRFLRGLDYRWLSRHHSARGSSYVRMGSSSQIGTTSWVHVQSECAFQTLESSPPRRLAPMRSLTSPSLR